MNIKNLINNVFTNPHFNDLIDHFDKYKQVRMKSMIITYLIMVRTDKHVLELTNRLLPVITEEDEIRTLVLDPFILEFIFEKFDHENLVDTIINNYLINGYYFHSFNTNFTESIKSKGLSYGKKTWNDEEVQKVRQIFRQRGKLDVFGMYSTESKTPIFLAPHLTTSARYGMGSPEWFQHFTAGGMGAPHSKYYRFGFRNRDYDTCLKNVIMMCKENNLNEEESEFILNYFDKHYKILATDSYPSVALISKEKYSTLTRDKLIEKEDFETDLEYLVRTLRLYNSNNKTIRESIKPEDILIIDYGLKTKEKKNNAKY